ncbi:hypothetical protein CY35_11G067200 [Sphagnum magellanicum]|nr:hypothetical protein CY35_11G067200 [Sphagnum magellanicum]
MADDASAKGMDSVDTTNELGRLASRIIPHILNLYNCKSTALDYEIYAPNAEFEDPLMQAHGVPQIKSAFYAIPKVFSEGKMVEFTVEEEETTSGSGEVEDGKVVRHEDLWDKNPLWNRKTVSLPLVGRTAETWRRMNMLVTHVLMGFGKDQRPVN